MEAGYRLALARDRYVLVECERTVFMPEAQPQRLISEATACRPEEEAFSL